MAVRGRFAPSPSGRMHLGNLLAALLAWLDVRSQGGTMVLRIEDLDPQRCSLDKARQLAVAGPGVGRGRIRAGILPV